MNPLAVVCRLFTLNSIFCYLYPQDERTLSFPQVYVFPYSVRRGINTTEHGHEVLGIKMDNCPIGTTNEHCPDFVLYENTAGILIGDFFVCGRESSDRYNRDGNMRYLQVNDSRFEMSYVQDEEGCRAASLVALESIDREKEDVVYLQLTAVDFTSTGHPQKEIYIQITILDVNDNPPMFEKSVIYASVLPRHLLTEPLVRLEAHDPDMVQNETIYSLDVEDPDFYINESDGCLFARRKLTKDRTHFRSVIVRATDASNGLNSTVEVVLLIVALDKFGLEDFSVFITTIFSVMATIGAIYLLVVLRNSARLTDRSPLEASSEDEMQEYEGPVKRRRTNFDNAEDQKHSEWFSSVDTSKWVRYSNEEAKARICAL
ncbi:hypothetical protein ACOME3_001638 [Neoechinorhynchus agilis]